MVQKSSLVDLNPTKKNDAPFAVLGVNITGRGMLERWRGRRLLD
jgi:hypothetical protein